LVRAPENQINGGRTLLHQDVIHPEISRVSVLNLSGDKRFARYFTCTRM
jgi:hypothetical protein